MENIMVCFLELAFLTIANIAGTTAVMEKYREQYKGYKEKQAHSYIMPSPLLRRVFHLPSKKIAKWICCMYYTVFIWIIYFFVSVILLFSVTNLEKLYFYLSIIAGCIYVLEGLIIDIGVIQETIARK